MLYHYRDRRLVGQDHWPSERRLSGLFNFSRKFLTLKEFRWNWKGDMLARHQCSNTRPLNAGHTSTIWQGSGDTKPPENTGTCSEQVIGSQHS